MKEWFLWESPIYGFDCPKFDIRDLAECWIPQTADRLGRSVDNLGKDIRTIAGGVAGVGDSAEVYALIMVNDEYQKDATNH